MSAQVIGYIRVSTLDQAREGFSLEDQRRKLHVEAKRRVWSDFQIIADQGESGASLDRPGISRALDMLRCGDADTLVVTKLDRLSRSLADFASLTSRALREGWAIVALDLGVDMTTPSGELLANVMASFARYERRLIRERVAAGREQKARNGTGWVVGRPPYGYIAREGWLDIDADAAAVVRRIFNDRARGENTAHIVLQLNREGVPSPGGTAWDTLAVRRILRRPTYAGAYAYRGHSVESPAIVTIRTWKKAQRAR